jgi:DNA-binding LytR/AlgR family response regulator
MKCIIVDDEKLAREVLSLQVLKSSHLILKGAFDNAIDAIKYLNEENDIDLIFLDIHMPNFSGFDFIKTIKNPPQIILVTTDKNFAIEAFNYDCVTDYLAKPIQQERFDRAIERVKINNVSSVVKRPNYNDVGTKDIYINIDKRLVKIDIFTIKFIHANGDYILINTETQNYIVHTTLKKMELKLPKSCFVKTHRSYLININKIIDIQDNSVLIGKQLIPISKGNKTILFESLNLL